MRRRFTSLVALAIITASANAHILDTSTHRVDVQTASVRTEALGVITSGSEGRKALETAIRLKFDTTLVLTQSSIANVLLLEGQAEALDSQELQDELSRLATEGAIRFVSQVYDGADGAVLLDAPDIAVKPVAGVSAARLRSALDAATSRPVIARPSLAPGAVVVRSGAITHQAAAETAELVSALSEVDSANTLKLRIDSARVEYLRPVSQKNVLLNGQQRTLDGFVRTRTLCGSDDTNVSPEMLRDLQEETSRLAANPANVTHVNNTAGINGFDLQFNLVGAFTNQQLTAIKAIETLYENRIADPATVVIRLRFAPLGSGILGQASSTLFINGYSVMRNSMQSDGDDDALLAFLPTGNSVGVRFNGNSDTVTNKTDVIFTQANLHALGGFDSGEAASITFSTNFAFDYTPPTSSSLTDFRSVFAHEIGHALGFVSFADSSSGELTILDLFRFQRSDGLSDYNPDTFAEFQTTPRLVDENAPGTINDVNSDIIDAEFRMSDGVPSQASHFAEGFPGLMDPTLGTGQTFAPDYLQAPDRIMLDLIGWDDADCNGNDIADEVEIDDGLVDDLDGNRVPDVCECALASAPIDVLGSAVLLNRYIAIRPNNLAGEQVAIRVTFDSFMVPEDPTPGAPDFSALNGLQLWAGPPEEYLEASNPVDTFVASRLQCEPYFHDWSALGTIHLYGEAVVPSTDMTIEAVSQSCELRLEEPASYSIPVAIRTADWGDAAVPFAADTPASQPDLADILTIVDKLLGQLPPLKAQAQLQPNVPQPNQRVDISDVLACVDAFLGQPYPFAGPAPCP